MVHVAISFGPRSRLSWHPIGCIVATWNYQGGQTGATIDCSPKTPSCYVAPDRPTTNHTEGSAVRPGKGRDRTDAGGYKRSLPFTTSRILGVIGSQSSHWSGRLIRVPDKDKDKDKDVGTSMKTEEK